MNPNGKYKPFPTIEMVERRWPDQQINKAPIWCSVDLRDGNQALATPMTVSHKIEMFKMLVECGFKEIEVGFPAASPTEYEFIRRLITDNIIPDDVTIQVLVQAREDLIKQTVESLVGAKRAIIHLYNSTSPAQRRIVFGLDKPDIIALAVHGTKCVKENSARLAGTKVLFQYSPESFSATEVDFALEVCGAVMETWQPTFDNRMIINLPNTVEVAMPNVYADQIEWFCAHMRHRDSAIISVHTHNDRGTGVASTELAMLAGAERVEGTLFGNGERTGNVDIVTVALNLYTQGIDPQLDFSHLDSIRAVYEKTTGMTVPVRQPYSGELVFTAFSGSHQDAIRKGFKARNEQLTKGSDVPWDVPYLTIDPCDIARRYDEVIRVNGQSGKGGIAYLLESECHIFLPKDMQREFGSTAGRHIDALGREVTSADLQSLLWNEYIERDYPYALEKFHSIDDIGYSICQSNIKCKDETLYMSGTGNGPIDAFVHSLRSHLGYTIRILDQSEHTLGEGSDATAIAYVKVQFPDNQIRWGAGVDTSIKLATVRAIVSALNRKDS